MSHPNIQQTREALRQSEEMFRLMIESVQDFAIYMLDEEGRVASWNIGAERAKGYTADEIIGEHFSVFYTPEDVEKRIPWKNLDIARREGHCLDEGWRIRKDGSRFWGLVVITAVKNKDGSLRGFAKITRDMTEKKFLEQALERKVEERTKELRQKNRELEQFAYVASHDLQEPLRLVSNYADLLQIECSAKLNEEEKEMLRYVLEGAERAQQLIRDVLQFAQVGAREKAFQATDFNAIIKQTLDNLRVSIRESGAEIETGPLPVLNADAAQIGMLMQNLLSNALKYRGAEPPKIRVTAQEEGPCWVFSVEDNGIGVEPEYRERIFQLFQRIHPKHKYPGTGLGLAICQKIVERHDGTIWVESEPGKGSTFKFRLPKKL